MSIRIECEAPHDSGPCPCCGGKTTTLTRVVYRDENACAIYYARFSDNHPDHIVCLAVSIGAWGEGSRPEGRVSFALEMRLGPSSYEVGVRDAASSPWNGKSLLGPMLDRAAALAHPLIKEVFHITDHAVVEDAALKAYLDGARA